MEVAELAPDMILIRRYVHATLVLKLHSTAQHSTAQHSTWMEMMEIMER
jgi:hypothetical protein